MSELGNGPSVYDMHKNAASQDREVNMVTDSYEDFLLISFVGERLKENQHTVTEKLNLGIEVKKFISAINTEYTVVATKTRGVGTFAKRNDGAIFMLIEEDNSNTKIKISGSFEDVKAELKSFESRFPYNPCYINWVYDPQYLESITMPLNSDNMPSESMYPFLKGESLANYYDRFNDSSANILILIGPPGTGKTTFIRGLLAHSKHSATLAYNRKIIEQDSFFVDWYNSKNDYMILEDSDNLLIPREDGNDMMARFLNLGDGLMSIKNKKIIFSTNLPHVADIDEALTRPGRCFDIIEFDFLNQLEARKVAEEYQAELPYGDKFTLSDIFASKRNEVKYSRKSKFGFI